MSDVIQDTPTPQDSEISDETSNSTQTSEESVNPIDAATKEIMASLEDPAEDGNSTEEDAESEEEKLKKQTKEEKKAWKLKVGGKDIEINDENELIKRAQMGYSAEQKWQEASQMKKEMDNFLQVLQQNPSYALEQMGFDVDDLAKNHLQGRIDDMQKSPEQLERETLQKELEDLRTEREKEKETTRQSELKRMQDQYAIEIENDISTALDEAKSLPKSPYAVKRIADAMILAFQRGHQDVTVQDVLPIVEKEIKSEIQNMFSAMPEELVEAVVGKDTLNRLRKRRVSRARKAPTKPRVEATGRAEINKVSEESKKTENKSSAKDFFKNLGNF